MAKASQHGEIMAAKWLAKHQNGNSENNGGSNISA